MKNKNKYIVIFLGLLFGTASAFCAFNVKDYGAHGDGSADDTAAILAAITAADASNSVAEVYFPAGYYRISSTNEYALQLENLSDIRLIGETTNTILLVSNPGNGCFNFLYCTNICVEKITIDYDPLPFTQGTIIAVDTVGGTFDLQIDSGYPELSNPAFSIAESKWGLTVDLSREAYGLWAYFSSAWTNISGRTWRMKADEPTYLQAHPLSVGDRYAHMARRWTAFAINCNYCTGVELKNVTIHATAGLSVGMIYSTGIKINGLNVEIKPGSSRLLSTNGDCIHSAGCADGLIIENCSFKGMPDDGINIHGRGGMIISNLTDKIKWIGTPRPAYFAVGDELQILNNQKGGIRGNIVVSNAVQINNIAWEITFDKPMLNLNASWYTGDKISCVNRCGQGSIIRNNFFGTHRGRDIIVQSHDITITNNHFYNPSLAWESVSLFNKYTYHSEGPPPYNINILGNKFEGGSNKWSWANAAIGIHSFLSENTVSPTYDSSNILIKANSFINIDGIAVEATSISNLQLIDNIVNTEYGIKIAESPVVLLDYANFVIINNLNIYDLNPVTYAGIHIKNTVPSFPNSVTITNLNTVMATNSINILDDRGAATLNTDNDSMAVGADTNGNYGNYSFMRVRHQSSSDWGNYFPIVKFDLSILPKNITVTSARMRFYTNLSDDSGSSWPAANNFPEIAIFNNLQDWDETTVTYNNRPECFANPVESLDHFGLTGVDAIYFTGTNKITSGGWLEYAGPDTRDLLQGWANGTIPNYGITIKGIGNYTDTSRYFDLQTKENGSSDVQPQLIVNFTNIPEPSILSSLLFAIIVAGRKPHFFGRYFSNRTFRFWMAGRLKFFIHALGHGYRISSGMTPKEVPPVFRSKNPNYGDFGQPL